MSRVQYKRDALITSDQTKNLYDDAGWFTYTEDMPRLMEAIDRSLYNVGIAARPLRSMNAC